MRRQYSPPPPEVSFLQGGRDAAGPPQQSYGGIQRPPVGVIPIGATPDSFTNPSVAVTAASPVAQPQQPTVYPTGSIAIRDNQHYGVFASVTGVMINIGSVLILAAPSGLRNFFSIRNTSAAGNIFIGFGKDATTGDVFKLAVDGILVLDAVVSQDDIYVLGDAVNTSYTCTYSNISN